MSEFHNVTVVKKANIYFDGKASSRTILFADGSKKTLGIMLPGEYEFNNQTRELMEILAGDIEVLLPKNTAWQKMTCGQSFEIPAQSTFKLKVNSTMDYCCSYFAE